MKIENVNSKFVVVGEDGKRLSGLCLSRKAAEAKLNGLLAGMVSRASANLARVLACGALRSKAAKQRFERRVAEARKLREAVMDRVIDIANREVKSS